ncbi:FAD-binding oxidoreductase [Candidatus Woesearchaeota archaeon]|nr:FAD-binding oxidoreductase [Candidatus Woesearchaeota archaeon]
MSTRFGRIVGEENTTAHPAELEAYSFVKVEKEISPMLVVWPQTTEHVIRILRETNPSRAHVLIRGGGTSQSNEALAQRAIILSTERMNKPLYLDKANKTIEVQAGMTIADLHHLLSDTPFILPFTAFNPASTVGGLFARDSAARESESVGTMKDIVEEYELVDATGKVFHTKRKDVAAGKEGLSGVVTRLKLRLVDKAVLSIDVWHFQELTEMLKKITQLKNDKERVFVEFIDKKIASGFGYDPEYTLIVGYTSLKGAYNARVEVKEIIGKLDYLHTKHRKKDYYYVLDPTVGLEKSYDLVRWCEENDTPLHGHAGIGFFYAYFKMGEKEKMDAFRRFMHSVDGKLGENFGRGVVNYDFLTQEEKKAFIKLKDEYDYNNTLNPGRLISYR